MASVPKPAILGAGALGSAIAEEFLRCGTQDILSFDDDILRPHNLARHTAGAPELFHNKAGIIASRRNALSLGGSEVAFQSYSDDILRISHQDFVARIGDRKLIDATADEGVRRYLTCVQQASDLDLIRVELLNAGRLGVLFSSANGSADLIDLYCSLLLNALSDPAVQGWLDDEAAHPLGPEQLVFGFGCASVTTRLPNFVVRQHVSAFMPNLLAPLESGFGLNPLDAEFRPLGWRWFPVPEFHRGELTATGWRAHLHPDAIAAMRLERERALPNETGGYLYGAWDVVTKTVSIVFASPLPPDSQATPSSVKLGPAARTPEEMRLADATHGRLHLCGTWHSHTADSASLSTKDRVTFDRHHTDDRLNYIPSLMVVVADEEILIHLDA